MHYTLAIIMGIIITGLLIVGEVKKALARKSHQRTERRLFKEMCQDDAAEFLNKLWAPPEVWFEGELAHYEHRTNGGLVEIQPDGTRVVRRVAEWTGREANGRIS